MKEYQRTDTLTAITILLVIAIAVILISYKAPRLVYKTDAEMVLSELTNEENFVKPGDLKALLAAGDAELVDLRNAGDFFVSHIEGAANIPLITILDEEVLKNFADEQKTFVLYGEDHVAANGTWVLLRQLGYDNIRMLLGGYDNYLIMDQDSPDFIGSYEELVKSKYDIGAEISANSKKLAEADANKIQTKVSPATRVKPKPATTPSLPRMVAPAEVEEDEGC
jgi:rhodanese-related sulfurtransferase